MNIVISLHTGGDYMNNSKELDLAKVAKRVYDLIIKSEYSIEYMADELGVSESIIYRWGKTERYPNLKNVFNVSQFFQVPLEVILE